MQFCIVTIAFQLMCMSAFMIIELKSKVLGRLQDI